MRFAGDRTQTEFSPISLQSGASGGNYSAAAGVVDLGNSFAAQRDNSEIKHQGTTHYQHRQ
jgi:hypothetical protein